MTSGSRPITAVILLGILTLGGVGGGARHPPR
jgi:hypothetical protein